MTDISTFESLKLEDFSMNNLTEVVAKLEAHTKVSKTQIIFKWKIEQFSFCSKKPSFLESSTFSSEKEANSLKWKVRLYTKGVSEKYRQYIGIFLVLVQDKSRDKKTPKEVTYSFCILNASDQKVNLVRSHEGREFKENDQWGFPKFLSRSLLEDDYNNLIPNDHLTIIVEMCIYGHISTSDNSETEKSIKPNKSKHLDQTLKVKKKSKTETKNEMLKQKSFKDFYLNHKYSDLFLVTSDGKELPVHKVLLANESPVFSHKFDSLQLDATKADRLELKNFDSETVTDILKNLDFKSSLDKLLNLTDAYNLVELKSWIEDQMINNINVSNSAKYYLIANQCNALNLKEKVGEFLKNNLNQISETSEFKKLSETHSHIISEIYKKILIDKN